MRFSLFLRIAALACLLGCAGARAQSLTLSPAAVPLKGSFGQSTTQVLTLQNGTDQPLDFGLEVRDVVVRDGARAFVEAGALPGSIAATAVAAPRELHLAPHTSGSVTLTVTVPAATTQRAVVALFQGRSLVRSGPRKARLSLGALLTFTLTDKISVAPGPLEATPASASANTRIAATLFNDGTEPVVPGGMALILDSAGRVAGKAPFTARRLLPGERVTLSADYPGELAAGSYRIVATFDIEGRPLPLSGTLTVP